MKRKSIRIIYLLLIILLFISNVNAQNVFANNIIPQPQKFVAKDGYFKLTDSTAIAFDDLLKIAAKLLKGYLQPATGFDLLLNPRDTCRNVIELRLQKELGDLGEEGYKLDITDKRIVISASHPKGILWGIQTLRQLLPTEIMREAKVANIRWQVPCLEITDKPRFCWRGLMIDYSRTFWNKHVTERIIDVMSFYKMNVLHMHLTDDQGWRIEIKKYPALTEKASHFAEEFHEPKEREGFFTQDDIRELVAYAHERNIEIVPEIEMPGHSSEVFAAYPQLSCTGETCKIHPFFKGPGIHKEIYCAGNDATFEFLENVLAEVMTLFPGEYIHVGGDEAPKQQWQKCSKCQQRIKAEGLKDEDELQSWFIKRIEKYLNAHSRKIIGWNDILQGGLAPNAAVMFWHGDMASTLKAAAAGHPIVMTPTSFCYFDYSYEKTPTRKVYSYDPVPAGFDSEYRKNILGVQANFWSHIDRTVPRMNRQIFPRLLALSEVGWTEKEHKEWQQFRRRLEAHKKILKILDFYYFEDKNE